jgi:hypothetical protein
MFTVCVLFPLQLVKFKNLHLEDTVFEREKDIRYVSSLFARLVEQLLPGGARTLCRPVTPDIFTENKKKII